LEPLEDGTAYRFADYATLRDVIPGSGAGVYTIWDEEGALVYVGVAGRNPDGTGLASRLRSHAGGRRSGDQFCVYVADHYVLPDLTREQIHRSFVFRFVPVADYATALRVERAVKDGGLRAGRPRLNPARTRA
jgi:hypothetical protein